MDNEDQQNKLLKSAIKHLLKPLIRFLIQKQLTLPTLMELVKSAYVEVAERDSAIEGKAPTDSRINLLTGVHRKDVKRLRDLNEHHQPSERLSISSLMLASWMSEAPFNQGGQPLALAKSGDDSFTSLANLYSRQNIRATSIMENWLEMGWISEDQQGLLHLNLDTLQENQLSEDQLFFFAENLADHMATSTHNLNQAHKMFERAVFYNALSRESVLILQKSAQQQSMAMLQDLNKQALTMQKHDQHSAEPHYRFRLGSYFYTDLR
ncbi:MAG: DUF6502 family protein [Bermanella sp.]